MAPITFFDMAVTLTPPSGHFQPQPLLLGASWQPNDIRILIVSAYGNERSGVQQSVAMFPHPPTGFTAAYEVGPGFETRAVFWRRLQAGDTDTEVKWPKPPSWNHFLFATLTARGTDPTTAPVAGPLSVAYQAGDATATVSSVTVPAAGAMALCLGTIPDPNGQGWPNWASALGVPTGWTALVATDKSGPTFDQYTAEPAAVVVGKSYPSAGTTGDVEIPTAIGLPAFIGMYVFLRPAQDTTIIVGAA